jgi:hypothetical protein
MTARVSAKIIHPGFCRSIIPVQYNVPGSNIPIDENTVCCESSDACALRLALAVSCKDIHITGIPAMIRASHSLSFCIMCIRHQAHFDPSALDGLYQDDPLIRENPDAPFDRPLRPSSHNPCIRIERVPGTTIHPRRVVAQMIKSVTTDAATPYYILALFPQCNNTFMIFSRVELERIGWHLYCHFT